jgi:hypothetical protein
MSATSADQKSVDDFLTAIAPYQNAFPRIGFSYLAVKLGELYLIIRGRVFLNTSPPVAQPQHFQSPHVRAGHYTLEELGCDVRGFINRLVTGTLETSHGPLHFFANPSGRYATSFTPFHPDGLLTQRRLNVLTIVGGETETIRQPDIDWEIKAASPPYDGLQELANEFGLGVLAQRPPYVEVVAYNVGAIDAQNCRVAGTNANIHVLLAKGLLHDHVSLGYRVYAPEARTARAVVSGSAMQWTEEANFDRGIITIPVPVAAVLNCTVSYDKIAQSHYWLSDPDSAQNPRRAVYEAFDPKLENLRAIIANAQGRGEEARDMESVVAWLLWMLGFSVAHLNTRRTRDAADLLVTSPAGHFAVVECTTGLLKAENKLSLLHERAEAVRRSLAASNRSHLHLLPVMVTSKVRADIAPDIETTEKLGILIMTRESLESAINRTLMQPNADKMYAEFEQAVSEALAKYQIQGPLQLDSRGE